MSNRVRLVAFGLFAAALFLIAPISAQQPASSRVSILGSVVDAALNPLTGVAVTLERRGTVEARTTTDAAGAFRFTNVAIGSVRIRAEHAGFPAFVRDLTIPAGAPALKMPIVLTRPEDTAPAAKSDAAAGRPTASPIAAPPATAVAGAGGGAGGRGGGAGSVTAATERVKTNTPVVTQSVSANFVQTLPRSDRDALTYFATAPGETYSQFEPNRFHATLDHPLSTFGADVDTASYSNVRRFLSSGQLPPSDAIRIEELVNYFRFGYGAPRDGRPLALTTEIGDCPWAPSHKLVLIGARAATPAAREITGRNIVLLIDVSGSMASAERLPLIKTALGLFVDTLKPDDSLAIVTYAGTSGIALPPTPARRRDVIQRAISELNAGGSTNGGQGLVLAYRTAREAFIPGGVNRVILATDGDFNVGIVSQQDLFRLIERERESGVFLSVFGVGSGNLKDATMEMLADRGNGHYAYLDSLQEARRVLIREGDATLENVAKDVKFQVEFNPAVVSAWKLLGYENRALRAQDFNNDRKDAGEMGAGHTVTVLYEVVPAGVDASREDRAGVRPEVDPLKYQPPQPQPARPVVRPPAEAISGEWLTVKARYKLPDSDTSDLITKAVRPSPIQHLPLASAVVEFGLILRDAPRSTERWDALTRRLDRLTVPTALVSDVDGLKELVATAAGLARIR